MIAPALTKLRIMAPMVRPTQLLHPQREPAPVRPAATVLLLRDTPQGIEVLMTRRSMTASFAPGAYVFPGGGVDALDAAAHAQASRRETQSDLHLTQAIAAIRESFEELGILLARREDGTMANANDIAALDRKAPFAPQCAARGLSLAASEVFVLAHWITDRDLPRRFDVPFLVARMPEGQAPVADETEQFEPVWVRPLDALARHRAGQFFIIFPTIRTLERLQDFASVEAVLQACAATEERFGRIDILLNNAGISMNKPSLELTPAEWRRAIDIDLSGVFYCAQAAGRRMARQGGGVILSTASIWGLSSAANRLAYCAAKAGVVSLTKCLAAEWAQHCIRVNAICPGYTHTSLMDELMERGAINGAELCGKTPINRLGRPEEMAEAALYLASDASAFITGHALVSDGGWLANGY